MAKIIELPSSPLMLELRSGDVRALRGVRLPSAAPTITQVAAFTLSSSSITEGIAPGTTVATINGGTAGASYTMIDGAGSRFAVSGNAVVAGSTATDFETATSHQITLRASKAGFSSLDLTFSITINNAFEQPSLAALTLSAASVTENAGSGVTVGAIIGKTAGSTLSLTNDAGGRFVLSGTNILTGLVATDFETATSHSITIRETLADSANSPRDTTLAISVTNVFEQPSLSPLAFSATTFLIGTASSGTITGATAGSTISASGLPSGLTVNGAARTWAWSGSGSAASPTITLTETLADSANSPRATNIAATVSAPAPDAYTLAMMGDSRGVGIDLRTAGTDLDWPNVFQVRQRAPAGISSDISPLDQAIAPDGNDYLSIAEYVSKKINEDTTLPVYIVPHNWNGTSIGPSGWGVGNSLHEAYIARVNSAQQLVRAVKPNAKIVPFIIEGTNDWNAGSDPTGFETATRAYIADIQARVFKNGASGATITDSPIIIMGGLPENLVTTMRTQYELVLRRIAGTTANCKFYKVPEGRGRTDNVHESAAGIRLCGPEIGALLSETVAPTLTNFAATGAYTLFAGQKMLFELTADRYCWWTLSGTDAALLEVVWLSDGVSGINLSRMRPYLRFVGDAAATQRTYSFTLTAKSGAGNVSSQAFTITGLAAFGSAPSTVSQAQQFYSSGATTNDAQSRSLIPVTLGAGMNVIVISKSSGAAPDIASVTFNGMVATRDPSSAATTGPWMYHLPSAAVQSGNLVITPTSSSFAAAMVDIILLTGVQAAPASSAILPNASTSNPYVTTSITCPAGGVIVGACYGPGTTSLASGCTQLAKNGVWYSASRSTTGTFGTTSGSGTGTAAAIAAAFAPA